MFLLFLLIVNTIHPQTDTHVYLYVFTDTTLDLTAPMTANRWHWESSSIQVVPSLPPRAFMKPCMVWLFRTPPNPWFNGIAFPGCDDGNYGVTEFCQRTYQQTQAKCETNLQNHGYYGPDTSGCHFLYNVLPKLEKVRVKQSRIPNASTALAVIFGISTVLLTLYSILLYCTVVWSVVQKGLLSMRTMQETIWRQWVRWFEEKEGEMEMTGLCSELWFGFKTLKYGAGGIRPQPWSGFLDCELHVLVCLHFQNVHLAAWIGCFDTMYVCTLGCLWKGVLIEFY
jgi:hypothetical protein